MNPKTPSPRLCDLPLWRLLVALADAERVFGPADPRTKQLADAVQTRLLESGRDAACPANGKGGKP